MRGTHPFSDNKSISLLRRALPYATVYITPLGRFSMVDTSTVGILSAPKRWALEASRRELSEYVSFGVGTLLVVKQSTLENRLRGVLYTPLYAGICRSYLQMSMASCRTLCGQFQLFTSTQTNPTRDLTLPRTPTLWGTRGRQGQSRGSAACFGGVFPKSPGDRKPSLDQSGY